ncbi:AraC family transcriptional regulator [Cohnella sp. REN36]|uniref:helix-turn-helix transcriptional regulator n=1 Tax=Cohnella sp. REN36 TaxID=2887347 RepID=UPI001D14F69C|nr:AraC family transcriptional regulator [Cohnella sp. REN36]MCC3375290.1 AraC family transcriptional regulator [Cohnella sp. REN36]
MKYSWKAIHPCIVSVNLLPCEPGFVFGPRIIQDHQLIYVVRGKGSARIQNRTYKGTEGDLFYYGPGVVHEFRADVREPFAVYGLHFSLFQSNAIEASYPSGIQEAAFTDEQRDNELWLGERPETQFLLPEHSRPTFGIQAIFAKLLELYSQGDDFSILQSRAKFIELLTGLFAWTRQQNLLLSEPIRRLKRFLDQNAEQLYERKWLSECTSYHEEHAARLFRKYIGMSPHDYHIRQKMIRAQQLLQGTDRSITDIARQLNLSNVHYFSKLFKKMNGISPLEYRNLRKFI